MPNASFNATEVQRSGRGSGGITGSGFRPGTSGNPSGRPRGIEARAREYTEPALAVLVDALNDPDRRIAVTAAGMLLDRGWGKPAQAVIAPDNTQRCNLRISLLCANIPSGSSASVRPTVGLLPPTLLTYPDHH
jgi:hypothetical protein